VVACVLAHLSYRHNSRPEAGYANTFARRASHIFGRRTDSRRRPRGIVSREVENTQQSHISLLLRAFRLNEWATDRGANPGRPHSPTPRVGDDSRTDGRTNANARVMATRRAVRRALDVIAGTRSGVGSNRRQSRGSLGARALSASSASTSSEKTSEEELLAKRIEDAVREGRRPAFTDVAEHVFAKRRGGGKGDGGGGGGGRGWDWHAWHFFVSLLPAAAAYACVRYINEHYEPELVALMEQQRTIEAERLFGALERSKAEREESREEEKSKALELRIADLEAKLAVLTAAATVAAEKKVSADASPVESTKEPVSSVARAKSDAKSRT